MRWTEPGPSRSACLRRTRTSGATTSHGLATNFRRANCCACRWSDPFETVWTLNQLAQDYAACAKWAVESGADCIEINLSCPNVTTCDGQLYQDTAQAKVVCETVRGAIGATPLIVKIGHVTTDEAADELVRAVGESISAFAMTNSIAAKVGNPAGDLLFDGEKRGICGSAIRDASIAQIRRFSAAIEAAGEDVKLIGVGGIASAADVAEYLRAGAHACHLATSAMVEPEVGLTIRKAMTRQETRE